jgi:hypothetical protein
MTGTTGQKQNRIYNEETGKYFPNAGVHWISFPNFSDVFHNQGFFESPPKIPIHINYESVMGPLGYVMMDLMTYLTEMVRYLNIHAKILMQVPILTLQFTKFWKFVKGNGNGKSNL